MMAGNMPIFPNPIGDSALSQISRLAVGRLRSLSGRRERWIERLEFSAWSEFAREVIVFGLLRRDRGAEFIDELLVEFGSTPVLLVSEDRLVETISDELARAAWARWGHPARSPWINRIGTRDRLRLYIDRDNSPRFISRLTSHPRSRT